MRCTVESPSVSFGTRLIKLREWHKQAVLLLGGKSSAIITHPETDHAVCLHGGAQFRMRGLATVFQGVREIVDPHLFNPQRIPLRCRPGIGQDDLRLVCRDHVAQALASFIHDVRHIL